MTVLSRPFSAMHGWHRPLLANVTLMFALVLACVVGVVVDDRLLLGESIWLKPMKFGFGMGVYGLTLAWLLSKLHKGRRLGWWLGTVFAVAGLLDVGVVVYAAAHGTVSHFNGNTDAVAQTVRTVFSFGVLPLLLTTLVIAILVLIQRTGDPAMARALRAGLGLAIASMVVALWLSGSSGATPRTVTDANGNTVSMKGGHGIGDPDGTGMPITNWSTTGGDLRPPHFVGMHGIQVLLLVTAILGLLATRYGWLRDERVRARLVGIAALGYTGVFAVLTWQAKRGQSVVHPDWQTLTAFTAVAVFTLATTAAVIITARRRPALPTEETQHDDLPSLMATTMRRVG
ncbi:FtsH-binding integral membrane protein [Kibdelosporangium banguiense]|uniref:FtsH-binding integral membrane protein n=1 Tax=Kibdelosporangium banguiense TaxID=1365924 RepID=A0ABS4TSW5_9PSEU|nr:hypothetical protein [Kibdelosporangium banguiense]MBP2327493.1 FtsH-binding integral membrane protein [Kibdelosporangium banguiense]